METIYESQNFPPNEKSVSRQRREQLKFNFAITKHTLVCTNENNKQFETENIALFRIKYVF